ncbi:MAG: right-handed parallel beta-helix repeat-containing protein [Bacteroidota bacterium]
MLRGVCIGFVLFLGFLAACKPQEESITFESDAFLRFSTDTVFFDTVFTQISTEIRNVTKRFRVYNDNDNAVRVSEISLNGGNNSAYTLFVNGRPGSSFADTRILGGDSILVLVEVSIDPQDASLPFVVEDQVNFNTNGNQQDVKLVSWGQDANFLRDSVLACNTRFTADKPYVIYNSILVDTLCNLTIDPGAQIFSHNSSFIFIRGSIDVQGSAKDKVLFSNDRLDEDFRNAPGQWGGIIFLPGSRDNSINHAEIRNAEVGLYLGTPDEDSEADLIVRNTRIENIGGNTELPIGGDFVQPGFGIIAITSDLEATNVLINNCAVNALGNYAGGNYKYEHCTLASFSFDFFREDAAVVFSDNLVLPGNTLLVSELNVEMTNSIIWGNLRDELLLSESGEVTNSIMLENNLIRTQLSLTGSNFLNEDPRFFDPRDYVYALDTLSPAKDRGVDLGILLDLEGTERDNLPDLGAFERVEN